MQFSQKQWITLYNSLFLSLSTRDIRKIKTINKDLSLKEITEIYLPLSYLLGCHINSDIISQTLANKSFDANRHQCITPYIIGITGSVAVGKSTIAHILKVLLSFYFENYSVELVTTDGFLYPNSLLRKKNLMQKKGFPESYDLQSLINFISQVKSGTFQLTVPLYSHLIYDVIPTRKIIHKPDILILEGLNILQKKSNCEYKKKHASVSDFIDFSIYIDAPEKLLQKWYTDRFLKFCQSESSNPTSFFRYYSQFSKKEVITIAQRFWAQINGKNLKQNILPIRKYANLVLYKSFNHIVKMIRLQE